MAAAGGYRNMSEPYSEPYNEPYNDPYNNSYNNVTAATAAPYSDPYQNMSKTYQSPDTPTTTGATYGNMSVSSPSTTDKPHTAA
ncbi:hypothetical protein BDB00DRAFT_799194 [Zychaea mexicana]|uniref:uncharacterized protein n=1 Tax=Zychaea mexicana TaxID=64656 RepID=UPI0022FDFC67|nr:uncharacterized protein BDB00DRAFT_799194 [Zychaea mexicana]KAI9498712.1 hypothetical protein BDB00DRAFT_799194 [Zychaea mexicana]